VKVNPDLSTRGGRLKCVRLAILAMNLKELANALGLKSHSSISMWETGKEPPLLEHLITIADRAGVSREWMLDGKGETPDVIADERRNTVNRLRADAKSYEEKAEALESEARRHRARAK
jgi:transcriptional regulator with XRE-family HTH domain